jgi:hypothetical protein
LEQSKQVKAQTEKDLKTDYNQKAGLFPNESLTNQLKKPLFHKG